MCLIVFQLLVNRNNELEVNISKNDNLNDNDNSCKSNILNLCFIFITHNEYWFLVS